MRIWNRPCRLLCDLHLLGEHRELHAIWSTIVAGKLGYSNHPETNRWRGHLGALFARHMAQVAEFKHRGWNHDSPLDSHAAGGDWSKPKPILSDRKERELLCRKRDAGICAGTRRNVCIPKRSAVKA